MSMDDTPRDRMQVLDRVVEGLLRLETRGVVVLPENLPPRPWYLGGQWFQRVLTRPEDFIYIHEHTGLGMTFDISHAQLECNHSGLRLVDLIRECRPIIRHLHVADASGIDGEGVQIGDGSVGWPEALGELSGAEFTWVPEVWSGHLNQMAGFIEALNRLGDIGGL
jgi:N-acetylneuraminate synthase